jgi:hypothetical protein
MTEDQVERLRQAGISDDVIRDMMSRDSAAPSAAYIDPTAPSETFSQATAAGAPTMGPESNYTQLGAEAAMLVPDALKYVGGAALGGLGYYGLKKAGQAVANKPVTAAAPVAAPIAPVAPVGATPVAATPVMEQGGQRLVDFTKQQGQFKQPNILQRATDIAGKMRDIAASRVTAAAPAIARVAGAGSAGAMAFVPGNVGQNYPFPQAGPMRGQEINPATGRPWTPAELQQYNAQFQ